MTCSERHLILRGKEKYTRDKPVSTAKIIHVNYE